MTAWRDCIRVVILCVAGMTTAGAAESLPVWPDLAPGETTRSVGETLPFRKNEAPPVTRVEKITLPTLAVYPPKHPNGTALLILPGGGFSRVVVDKEGSEIADWLNQLGITAFVLSYRTKTAEESEPWKKPVQDAERALSMIRTHGARWQIDPARVGIMGLSAGGQAAARILCAGDQRHYEPVDELDRTSFRPDFALLLYPWNLYDSDAGALIEGLTVPADCPSTFLLHTDDDKSTSLGTVLFYAALKRQGIPAELHVYGQGGHGYGLRPVPGTQISTWTDHAAHWLQSRGLAGPAKQASP